MLKVWFVSIWGLSMICIVSFLSFFDSFKPENVEKMQERRRRSTEKAKYQSVGKTWSFSVVCI